jgi:hypothetical protein
MRGAEVGGNAKVMVLNDYESYNTLTYPFTKRLNQLIQVTFIQVTFNMLT